MKVRNFFGLCAAAALMVSCASEPVQTIENLKAAATGETTASTHYAAFSQKAFELGDSLVGNMFAATSYAESLHAAKHLAELAALGVVDFVPQVEPFAVDSTLANLKNANDGEIYEFTTMYPGFITIAEQEKALGALVSFDWANRAEIKHSRFYTAAIDAMTKPEAPAINGVWVVCTKCGDTYMASEAGDACELCGTPVADFKTFSL